jgi:glycosyltransferase involved in cell wall biosynthesis
MSSVPRVSVVIPVYNRADVIAPTLDSATSQTHPSYEVIVVDDGSSDGVADLVAARWPQVRIVRQDRNRGCAAALNRGVAEAKGELVAFLDSDDIWSPDKLLLQTEDFDRHPECALSFTDVLTGRTGLFPRLSAKRIPDGSEPERLLEQILDGAAILPSSVLLRKRDLEQAGGLDGGMRTAHDRDLWLGLVPLGSFRFLPLPLVRRVVLSDALSHSTQTCARDYERILTRFLERPEGAPFRRRRRILRARSLLRLAVRHADSHDLVSTLACVGRALWQDPFLAFRSRGTRVALAEVQSKLGWELFRALFGRRRRTALRRALRRLPWRRVEDASARVAGWPPFRPPADAAPRRRSKERRPAPPSAGVPA